MDLSSFLFWALGLLTAGCAIAVVVTQNIVRSATWLLFTLGGTSVIFFLLGADFVGATQLLVYVGGTLVLVVFGVMLTAQGPFVNMRTSVAEWAVSGIVGLLLLSVLVVSIFAATDNPRPTGTAARYAPTQPLRQAGETPGMKSDDGAKNSPYADVIGVAFVGVGVGPAHNNPNAAFVNGEARVVRMN